MSNTRKLTLGFESATGFLLARLGALSTRSWTDMLRTHGITPAQHGALLALAEHGPASQNELSRLLTIDPRNLSPVLDGLVARDLVVRDTDPSDRRRRIVALTAEGHGVARDLAAAAATIESDFLSSLTAAEQTTLNELLRTLFAAHMASGESPAPEGC